MLFGPGDKVTFADKDYLCNTCLEQTTTTPASSPGDNHLTPNGKAPQSDQEPVPEPRIMKAVGPEASSTPAKPLLQLEGTGDANMSSPVSDLSDILTDSKWALSHVVQVRKCSRTSFISSIWKDTIHIIKGFGLFEKIGVYGPPNS